MNQFLPESDFKWLNECEIAEIDWEKIETETERGFILEVDLTYPKKLHKLHSDFPLAPMKLKINNDELSDYQKNAIDFLKPFGYRRAATEKLLQTLHDKSNYILHFKNLKLYLELGMKLKKIHRVLSFHQSRFLKTYIEKNTNLRKNSKNDFEKDLFKLLNNAVFGKSIQDQRKHINVKLALNENQAKSLISKPNYEQFLILDDEKALVKMRKITVDLNRPIYIGFTVLELSKFLMFSTYYQRFKPIYGPNVKLNYFDTDSYLLEIRTKNLWKDFENHFKDIMDFSNFDKDHPLYDNTRAKEIGLLKCEYGNLQIKYFCGLKAKLYSIIYGENINKCTAKGVQKSVIKKFLAFKHYVKTLKDNKVFNTTSTTIKSEEHQLKTIQQTRMVFTKFDDKRYILSDGINTIPFGHYKIRHHFSQYLSFRLYSS